MIRKSDSMRAAHWQKNKLGTELLLAIGLLLLLGAGAQCWAQGIPAADEVGAHIQRAEQLLQNEQPNPALAELDAAFAIRQEARVLYLQGLAQQKLGNSQEAILRWQRFLVASTVAECCTQERIDASRRIHETRRLMELRARAGDSPADRLTLVPRSVELRVTLDPVRKTNTGKTAAIVVLSIIGSAANLALIAYGLSKIDLGSCCSGLAFSSGR